MADPKKIDAVFEGGGVKGIGLVGAVKETEDRGYTFENVAGTSAGAIVAALVAAGYSADALKKEMDKLDYNRFKDKGILDEIPFIGPVLSLGFEKGIYEGDYFEGWLRELLNGKKFKDLIMQEYENDPNYRWKLQVIAADLTHGRLLRLPRDLEYYGEDPDDFDVARAVRMSMSIPFFFEPVEMKDLKGNNCVIVDGGILSNYPVWIFDDGTPNPPWPTIGYKLVEGDGENGTDKQRKTMEGMLEAPRQIKGPISMLGAMFMTMMEAHDKLYIEDSNFARSIPIPTLDVGTVEFDLKPDKAKELYDSGLTAAKDFFDRWDFVKWTRNYRASSPAQRRDRV